MTRQRSWASWDPESDQNIDEQLRAVIQKTETKEETVERVQAGAGRPAKYLHAQERGDAAAQRQAACDWFLETLGGCPSDQIEIIFDGDPAARTKAFDLAHDMMTEVNEQYDAEGLDDEMSA